ncbi:hypothetical protein KO505_02595 [Psychrosphaera sp. F3M07]|uniref:hypothetical protein n=1 Tax=Psychrosphaera sp. F3M07 TaxID=2841560 RepID=UPI001C087719|nr:hypothetical protein [Psychrosphaera sp. F3M07]MBU2916848.1 hypothetical protein [Psychrosphaera sp. F3M07]
MKLTSQEIVTIKSAIKSRNKVKYLNYFLIWAHFLAILSLFLGLISTKELTVIAFLVVLMMIITPTYLGSPKYSTLLDILEKQVPEERS